MPRTSGRSLGVPLTLAAASLLATAPAAAQRAAPAQLPITVKPSAQPVSARTAAMANVTRLCHVFSSGTMYCRTPDQVRMRDYATTSAQEFQMALDRIYETQGLDRAMNGLMDCGSNTWAAAPQSIGGAPTANDVSAGLDACLAKLKQKMPGRGGVANVLNRLTPGAQLATTAYTPAGSPCRASGDPRISAEGTRKTPGRTSADGGTLPPLEIKVGLVTLWRKHPDGGIVVEYPGPDGKYVVERQPGPDPVLPNDDTDAGNAQQPEAQKADGGQRSDPNGDACAIAAAQFDRLIRECQRNSFSSYECQKLQSCSDPAITNPGPDSGLITCGTVTVAGGDEALRKALMRQCEMRTKPGPGSSPCEIPPLSGGSIPAMAQKICNSPLALVNESCLEQHATVTFMDVGRNLNTEMKNACSRIGGPCVTPTPTNGPSGPMPGPGPGGVRSPGSPGSPTPPQPGGRSPAS